VEPKSPLGALRAFGWSAPHGDALYQAACVYARAGVVDSALALVERAVAAGESIRVMVHDSDLAAIVDHPRFLAMRHTS